MSGNSKKAIKVYEKAMSEYDNYLLYYNHAIACLGADQLEKAYDSAIKAISNNPAHIPARQLMKFDPGQFHMQTELVYLRNKNTTI